jgi:hypothetical protein
MRERVPADRKSTMSLEQYSTYGFGLKVNLPYVEAVERTKAALKEQGFGVPTMEARYRRNKEYLSIA